MNFMAKKIFPLPDCTVDFAFQRIGGKYKGRILWYLHGHMILRYGELRRTVEGITAKMLTQTLRELEEDQLIIKTTFHEARPHVEYSLTDSGKQLIPFIIHLNSWGQQRMAQLETTT
jgi:DNA-binding HxlR family transcriptional regulator